MDSIIPEIENITKPGDVICDVMAGTNSIGYALKERNIIYSNDIQFYSYAVGRAMLSNYKVPTAEEAKTFFLRSVFSYYFIGYFVTAPFVVFKGYQSRLQLYSEKAFAHYH